MFFTLVGFFFVILLLIDSCSSSIDHGTTGNTTTLPDGLNLVLARNLLLAEVNVSRSDAGLTEVLLDSTANQVAQSHAEEMARNDYLSHLDLNGNNPVERYNLAGGWEPAYENAWSRKGANNLDQETVKQMHSEWMESEGHRDNVLLSAHTHVGIGFAYSSITGKMYGVELFISRKAHAISISTRDARNGDDIEYFAAFDPDDMIFSEVLVAREDDIGPQTAEWLRENQHYSLPKNYFAFYVEAGADNVVVEGAVRHSIFTYDRQAGIVEGEIRIDNNWLPGQYYLYTWGKAVNDKKQVLMSILTIDVK